MNTSTLARPPNRVRPYKARDYISYSAISTYQSCSLRYYFRYVAQLPEDVVPASLVFGSAIHAAVQLHFEHLIVGQPPPDLDILLDVFQAAWSERADKEITFPKGETFDSLCRLAERMLVTFQRTDFAKPHGQIIGIEEELRGAVIPGVPDLLARLDLVVLTDQALVVSDFKTAARAWGQMKVEDAAPQLLLYGLLAQELADNKPIQLQFALFTKTKHPNLELRPVRFESGLIERTKALVKQVWQAIQGGHFYPSPSPLLCPGCPFRKPCAAWRG